MIYTPDKPFIVAKVKVLKVFLICSVQLDY